MAGIVAGAAASRRRLLGHGPRDPAQLGYVLHWAPIHTRNGSDVERAAPYALTAGSVGAENLDGDHLLSVTSSSVINLIVGEMVNVVFPTAPAVPGTPPEAVQWEVDSGSGTGWVLRISASDYTPGDYVGEALGAGTLTPVVRRVASIHSPAGWQLGWSQPTANRQPRLAVVDDLWCILGEGFGGLVHGNSPSTPEMASEGLTCMAVVHLASNSSGQRAFTLGSGNNPSFRLSPSGRFDTNTASGGAFFTVSDLRGQAGWHFLQLSVRPDGGGRFMRSRVDPPSEQTLSNASAWTDYPAVVTGGLLSDDTGTQNRAASGVRIAELVWSVGDRINDAALLDWFESEFGALVPGPWS